MKNPILPFLKQQSHFVLDGGLATEFEARGHNLNHPLWSAKLLLENPYAVEEVHYDYICLLYTSDAADD